jgi:hypothetical protein
LTNPSNRPQIVNIPLENELQAAYAAYVHGELTKVALINLHDYNTTADNNYTSNYPRGSQTFTLKVPSSCTSKTAIVQRLIANGSDAVTGVTFDGYSYNYELDNGKPVLLHNVTRGEKLRAGRGGVVSINVPWSSAAILTFR